MSGGFTQVGPVFCFIQVLPHSKLQSILVEEMKVLRGTKKGGLRRRPSALELEEGPSRWREVHRGSPVLCSEQWGERCGWHGGGSVQTRLRGHHTKGQNWAAVRCCGSMIRGGFLSGGFVPVLREWPVL